MHKRSKILLVDDDVRILNDRTQLIREMGYDCLSANNGKKAVHLIRDHRPDMMLTGQEMSDIDGIQLLQIALETNPWLPVVVITGHGTIENAVKAIKLGAFDYLQKPFSAARLKSVIHKALQSRQGFDMLAQSNSRLDESAEMQGLVGQSDAIKEISRKIARVAQSDANVLIYGESGTGKELVARNIHRLSKRAGMPFIPIDCVALPQTLLESELFGFDKGAFTGAVESKPGVFEIASQGTIFLDEITEFDPSLQPKLLRVIQERQFRRIGSSRFIKVDVRIIAATNLNPQKAVENEKLREDLFYRLNVVPLYIPPLRDRRADISLLTEHFIDKHNPCSRMEIKGYTREAMNCLQRYHWPGNIRELENVVQRVLSLTDHSIIQASDLPEEIHSAHIHPADAACTQLAYHEAKERYLDEFTFQYLTRLLRQHNGNVTRAAAAAGISRKTLYRKIQLHDIRF